MKTARFFSIVLLLALVMGLFTAASAATPVTPTPVSEEVVINGNYDNPVDWDLANDTKLPMGEPSGIILSDAYLKYDCENEVLYALVLLRENYQIEPGSDGGSNWIKVYDFASNLQKIVSADSGNDGTPPDFSWVVNAQQAQVGWEVSAPLAKGTLEKNPDYAEVEIHAQVDDESEGEGRTSSSDKFSLNVTCFDYGDLPEEGKFVGYTLYETGARHWTNELTLGNGVTDEVDGKPGIGADLDDLDNGIVTFGNWGDGTGHIQYAVTGEGCLYGWLDYMKTDSNGDFVSYDPDYSFDGVNAPYTENIIAGVPVSNTNTTTGVIDFDLPDGEIGGPYYARFRLFDAQDCNAGVSLAADLPMYQGSAVNGEVEDYKWTFGPNAVSMAGFSASTESVPTIWIAVVSLLALAGITVFAWMRRRTV